MNALEARKTVKEASRKAKEAAEEERIKRLEADRRLQEDLRGKYAEEFLMEAYEAINKAANSRFNFVQISSRYFGRDETGKTLNEATMQFLISDGYNVELIQEHIAEYIQRDNFGEGDYSHGAYDKWSLKISW